MTSPAPVFMAEEAPDAPVADALMAVAKEVSDLAQLSDRLQSLISAALVIDGSTNADHMREFQAIDLIVQRLHGVALFVEALSDLSPQGWRLNPAEAAAHVPLTDLARRLSGMSEASPPANAGACADDGFELFA